MRALGLRVALITGDREATARAIAAKIGIDEIFAGQRPEGKVAALRELGQGRPVAFVGDGINDAPALAAADVGIAMGAGTDVAVESAQVALMSSDLRKVAQAFALSRATLRTIKQNLVWAFGYNILLIPLAMGALYPSSGLLLNPALGAAAMACSSLFVLGNALRLRQFAVPSHSDGDKSVPQPAQTIFAVSDMTCGHCAERVKKAALSMAPGADVQVDLASGEVDPDPCRRRSGGRGQGDHGRRLSRSAETEVLCDIRIYVVRARESMRRGGSRRDHSRARMRRPPFQDFPMDDETIITGPLYASRKKVYPQATHGDVPQDQMGFCSASTLGVYYLLPFLRWDRGPNLPNQAVLIDMPHRRFYFFFIQLWPQEVYYFTGLLIIAAMTLFMMNASRAASGAAICAGRRCGPICSTRSSAGSRATAARACSRTRRA